MTPEEIKKLVADEVAAAVASQFKSATKPKIDWVAAWSKVEKLVTPLLLAAVGAGVLWLQSLGKDNQVKIDQVHQQSIANNDATKEVAVEVKSANKEIKRAAGNPTVEVPMPK